MRRRLCHRALASVVCLPLLLGGVAGAQEDAPAAAPAVRVRPQPQAPPPFVAALAKLDWDAERRGPLIVVDPENVQPATIRNPNGSRSTPTLAAPGLPNGYSLAQLAPVYKHRVLRLRGLTAFVPAEMATFPTEPDSKLLERQARDMDGISGMSSLTQLLGTLTEAQWRQAGSEAGLGRGDLTATQTALFDRLIPASLALQSRVETEGGNRPGNRNRPPRKMPITAATRAALRVRVLRRYRVGLLTMGSQREFPGGDLNTVGEAPNYFLTSAMDDSEDERQLPPVPNRLKPGQMDMDSNLFDPNISLEGATTVGELVDRVRQATRVEVYADARIAPTRVLVRGKVAPASEVLKSLCWGLGGTFRRLQSGNVTFFLLTEDVVGIAPRLSRLTSGMIDGLLPSLSQVSGNASAMQTAGFHIFEAKPMRFIGPGRTLLSGQSAPQGVEFVPPSDLTERLVRPDLTGVAPPVSRPGLGNSGLAGPGESSVTVNAASLPQPVQNLLREQARVINERLDQDPKVRDRPDPGRAEIKMSVLVQLRHPNLGLLQEMEVPRVGPPPPPPKPEELALPPGNRAVRLTIADPEQARRAVAALRRRGFNQLWLYLPDTLSEEAERETVAAAVKAGTEGSPVTVIPVVSLLGRTPPAQPDGYSDLTSAGVGAGVWAKERSKSRAFAVFPAIRDYVARQPDWLLPNSPPAQARAARIARLAALPGLAGLAVRYASPPELFSPDTGIQSRQFDGFLYADVGFSSTFRADFARRNRIDPLDFPFPPLGLMMGMQGIEQANAPFLRLLRNDMTQRMVSADDNEGPPQPRKANLFADWLGERQKPNRALLVNLYTATMKAKPGLRLYLPDFLLGSPTPFNDGGGSALWASWDSAESFPGTTAAVRSEDGDGGLAPDVAARRSARVVVRVLSFESHLLQDQITANESVTATDPPARRLFFARFIAEQTKPLRDPKTGGRWDAVAVDLAYQPLDTALDLLTIWPEVSAPAEGNPATP